MEEKQNFVKINLSIFYLLIFLVTLTFFLTLFNTFNFFTERTLTGMAVKNSLDQNFSYNVTKEKITLSLITEPPVLGNKDANITITEFLDYECPFSKKYFTQSYPKILKEYIETGKAKLIFRDFPVHKNSEIASEASYCIREQLGDEAYFEMHDLLLNSQNLSFQNIKFLAKNFSINQEKFEDCLNSERYKEVIQQSLKEGVEKGVRGTPTLFINEKIIEGAQPYIVIKNTLESL